METEAADVLDEFGGSHTSPVNISAKLVTSYRKSAIYLGGFSLVCSYLVWTCRLFESVAQ